METGFPVDAGLLLAGVLLLVGVIASTMASRMRVPSLLLFLGLGMLVADEGLALVRFDDAALAQNIAIVGLVVILFEGGLGTELASLKRVGAPAGALATVGVVITAGVVAVAAWAVLDVAPETAMLLGAVVASTDAAAVFAALRSEPLPQRTQSLLRIESGMNDPVAVLLTIGLMEVWRADPGVGDWIWFLVLQVGVGAVVGLGVGLAGRWVVDHVTGGAAAALGAVTLAIAGISYGLAAVTGGSGFLAVYLTGVLLTGARRSGRSVLFFHEGLAATAQAMLFLLLGILVFPSDLLDELGVAAVVAAALIFVARPLAVGSVLVWWRVPAAEMAVVAWAGLRGAVPVVLATIPFTAGHPDGSVIFNVAFVVVVLSVALQAPTIGALSRRLGVVAEERVTVRREIVPVDAMDADLVEVTVPDSAAPPTAPLRSRPPPSGARVAFIHREDTTVVPDGDTVVHAGDVLLLVAPRDCDLDELEDWSRAIVSGVDRRTAPEPGDD